MSKKSIVVFYGNGLNQINNGIDWNGLLNSITTSQLIPTIGLNTMRYESIYLSRNIKPIGKSLPSQETTEFEIKREIAKRLREGQSSNVIYELLASMPFTDYITTNYDHCLEMALLEMGFKEVNGNMKENIYNIRRFRHFQKDGDIKRIWHIHGDLDKPRCIVLGYDHYCGCLAKVYEYVKGSYKSNKESALKIKKIEDRLLEGIRISDVMSWVDLFFISDIHFVGYGLDYTEIDIWWILNKRIRMIKERKISVNNNIVYHSIVNSMTDNIEKKAILKAFGVKCINYLLDKNYVASYKRIVSDL